MSTLARGVYLVDGVGMAGRPGTVNVSLLVDDDGSATLVDTGFAGITPALLATCAEAGVPVDAIDRIIITHHHPDHVGGLAEVVALTGAEVWAHPDDAGTIDGSVPRAIPPGMPPAAAAQMQGIPKVAVTRRIDDREQLDLLGGCVVLHTPGHTPGHISLLLTGPSVLLAGDTVRVEEGVVVRSPEMYTLDPTLAESSLTKLAGYDFEGLLPYHGEYIAQDASARFRKDLGL